MVEIEILFSILRLGLLLSCLPPLKWYEPSHKETNLFSLFFRIVSDRQVCDSLEYFESLSTAVVSLHTR